MNETTVKVIQAEVTYVSTVSLTPLSQTTSYLDSLTSRVLKFAMPLVFPQILSHVILSLIWFIS